MCRCLENEGEVMRRVALTFTRRLTLVVLIFCALAIALPVSAQSPDRDGNQLLDWCSVAVDHLRDSGADIKNVNVLLRYTRCLTYLEGYTDGSALCVQGVSAGQSSRVITKFLTDHPERLNESMGTLTGEALGKAFPCKH
jgi:hypothetical protein